MQFSCCSCTHWSLKELKGMKSHYNLLLSGDKQIHSGTVLACCSYISTVMPTIIAFLSRTLFKCSGRTNSALPLCCPSSTAIPYLLGRQIRFSLVDDNLSLAQNVHSRWFFFAKCVGSLDMQEHPLMRFTRMSIATLVILSNLAIALVVVKFRRCRRTTCGIYIGVLAFIDAIEGTSSALDTRNKRVLCHPAGHKQSANV